MMKLTCAAVALLIATTTPGAFANNDAVDRAKALFKRYVELANGFDPAVADLYSDDAVIKNKRTYPTGNVRELSMPAPQYKALIRQAMPLAKARGDRSTFTDCKYEEAGEQVRITCSRYSEMKKYTSPLTLVVGPQTGGGWLIFEELSESRP
jgi:ketosteroid isomerase-like protein